jgi:A/G-specific adenine glycosylase
VTPAFATRLLHWFAREGRHDLPWQHPRTPYRVWLAEVMLQQTQVAAVIPYFQRFVARYDRFADLAAAPIDEVLALWAGLGYYARARNLHAAAKAIVECHGGEMPRSFEAVAALPGIGRSTAGAVLAQAFGSRHAILDGNVKRVLARHAAVAGWPGEPKVAAKLWAEAEARTPRAQLADYTQAIMDLGATVCTARAPACARCPVAADCAARLADRIAEFPAAKPKRARPLRRGRLLLVENAEGALLLERRPPNGIWGGLWCPPWLAEDEPAEASVLADRHGLIVKPIAELEAIRHAFTHFELELRPLRLRIVGNATWIAERSEVRWLNIAAPERPGLPAPVEKLLRNSFPREIETCPEPYAASSSASTPKASTARRSPARSARASSSRSPSKPGASGSRTRHG